MISMIKFILASLGLLICISASSQNIYGYVKGADNGEYIPNAIVANGNKYVMANAYGYYSIAASVDSISYSAYGYATQVVNVNMAKDGRLDISLNPLHTDIEEVVVNAQSMYRAELTMARMSRHTISIDEIKSNVTIFGEPDAIKTIQNLPGVTTAADGSVNLSVRGSSHDQNMILLDEATVYNPSHALGLFTAFNPDAIANVEFYKGGHSPKYGGKLAAVVDMRMKEGNIHNLELNGSIGNVVSRLMVETPIVKDKGSMMIAGRYGDGSLVNLIADVVDSDKQRKKDKVKFYDICVKTNWHLSHDDRLFASAYTSHDRFKCSILSQDNNQEWGNKTATLRWNHIYSEELFANYTATASLYEYRQQQDFDVRDFEWKAGQSEMTLKADMDHYIGDSHLTYGVHLEGHRYNPGQIDPLNDNSIMMPHHLDKKNMVIGALYVNNERIFGEQFNVSAGLRVSAARNGKSYCQIEPRVALSYSLSSNAALKASYVRTAQYDHMLTNSTLGMPTDVWMPISKIIRPQSADMVSLGVHGALNDINVELYCETYYKVMHKVVDYRDNANLYMNDNVDLEVKEGRGRTVGLETMVKYENNILELQTSYTLSKSERQSNDINQGRWYFAAYDQRHNLSVNATFKVNRNDLSVGFKYHTGGRATLPYTTFFYDGVTMSVYTERNGYVLPDFHRLDMSWSHQFRHDQKSRCHSSLTFSIYNCYGRKNAYSVFVKGDQFDMSIAKGYMLYLYRWVPSVTYTFQLK